MNTQELKNLLQALTRKDLSIDEVMDRLRTLPFEDVGVAQIDHHRELRQGFPEVVFGAGKTLEQLQTIVGRMAERGSNVLITRLSADKGTSLQQSHPTANFDSLSGVFTLQQEPTKVQGRGKIIVVCAGTSDLPIAREAVLTARFLGNEVEELVDVGVAGLHRLLAKEKLLREAAVIIVVAGMEGALPSVVGGLVAAPVIAVPTSIGYGAAFGGVAALLGMLNSCAAGVTVVNIDNGFGAAYAASRINRLEKP